MKLRRLLTALGLLAGLCAGLTETSGQTALETAETRYRIAFYNVENLFYPTRDTNILDEDYTPNGSRHWSWTKFETKCHRIFKVIAALDAENPLLCIGLAEVENERALQQLCYGTPLRYGQYRFVHFDSPDRRGIDVALLYRADRLEILRARPLPVGRDSGQTQFLTRDILSVQARVKTTGDTLYLFVVHFPSKFGGALATDERRRQAGGTLRRAMDSIRTACPQAKLLAMGDFNATADEAALRESIGYVGARAADGLVAAGTDSPAPYINLMADFPPGVGSHKYRETWSLIDHIVVSRAMRACCRRQAAIFKRDFLLTEDKTYFGQKPFRTFVGPAYQGGYSDHLPVYVDLHLGASAANRPTR
ncbi:MAG: hypothetical protein K2G46_00030 [Bacteroidales bacterium]|nr:hypothetical protein [Bacteroidales bacterium]